MSTNNNFAKENLTTNFCPAPWLHTHITPQSERRLCCVSREPATWQRRSINEESISESAEYAPVTFSEYWNSEKMKDIRKRMLSGESLPECAACDSSLTNVNPYRIHFAETMYKDRVDEIISKTDDTGFTTMLPASYDYRISNLCNFKCRMCSEQSSSSLEAEKRKYGIANKREIWLLPENRRKITEFQETSVVDELWAAARDHRIEELYWAGGEPLMVEAHWEVMEYLVQTDQAKNIEVRYNTNLSRVSYKNYTLTDLLKNFKKVTIQASMDATGEIAEFIRTGLDWDSWVSNLTSVLELREKFGLDSVVIDVTITMPGLFAMKDLMKFAKDHNIKSYVKLCFSSNAYFVLSPMVLPFDLLSEILDDLLVYEEALNTELTRSYRDTFVSMKDFEKSFEHRFPDQHDRLLAGKKYQQKLEEIRPNAKLAMTDILSKNPKVLDWWNSIV